MDVALLSCSEYNPGVLKEAVGKAASIAGFPDIQGKRILVKPNVLNSSSPEKAVTTHPEFLRAVLRFLRLKGAAQIQVGDSPALHNPIAAAKATGLYAVTLEEGAQWVEFTPGTPRSAPNGAKVRSFVLASALEECDLVVNLPKLKTHRLTQYTGGLKNLFGLVPGLNKSGFHLRFPDRDAFGSMLVDLALSIDPCFTFMDAVIAMEGEGPGNGKPYPLGLVLASKDLAALDWVGASCIGYNPNKIPYLREAFERSGRTTKAALSLRVGPEAPQETKSEGFELIPYGNSGSSTIGALHPSLKTLARMFTVDRPIFRPSICIACGACVRICPAKALEQDKVHKSRIRIDDASCITCFCCHEVCPVGAIAIGKVPLRRWRKT
ncbi:MAG: iron-sulfur cluster-binding protein [Spirochaetes bacterium]|nr:MAG: iron-sulfur cluster-binding protein [Spirochaetota bacterium]